MTGLLAFAAAAGEATAGIAADEEVAAAGALDEAALPEGTAGTSVKTDDEAEALAVDEAPEAEVIREPLAEVDA